MRKVAAFVVATGFDTPHYAMSATTTCCRIGMLLIVTTDANMPRHRPPICSAIRHAREAAGLTQSQVVTALTGLPGYNVTQSHVSKWELDREPELDVIRALETALGLPLGSLLRSAGYVEDLPLTAESAIATDERLTGPFRRLTLDIYRSAIQRSAEARLAAKPEDR